MLSGITGTVLVSGKIDQPYRPNAQPLANQLRVGDTVSVFGCGLIRFIAVRDGGALPEFYTGRHYVSG